MFLPDINFWLALAFEAHAHHKSSNKWFSTVDENCCFFCRLTQMGFLRLSTNHAVFGEETVTMSRAWEVYDLIITDPRIMFMNEPSGVEYLWRDYTNMKKFSPKIWNDSYLSAFAKTADLSIITFDIGEENSIELEEGCVIITGKTAEDLSYNADKLGMNLLGINL